jgi:hypothetical protein
MFEQHKVFELCTRIKSKIVFLICSKKVTHLLLESQLSIEGGLELINSIFKPLHLILHFAYLTNKGIHLVILLEKLGFTDFTTD